MSDALRWLHEVANNKGEDGNEANNFDHWDAVFNKWYAGGASFRSLDSLEGRPNKLFQRWLMHPSYDDYWKNMAPYKTDFANVNIPVLTITGYYDADQMAALYVLNGARPETQGFIRQQVDFKDRSDTNHTASYAMIDSSVDVSNGVSFVSTPFRESFEINGSPTGELRVSINKRDIDFLIRW